jgi:hypothetical protein
MNKKVLLIVVSLFFASILSAQTKVNGIVLDQNNQKIEYFQVVLTQISDSSILTGGGFMDGSFEISSNCPNSFSIEIRSIGYIPVSQIIQPNSGQTISLDTVRLNFEVMDEITISAKRPVVVTKNGLTEIGVKSTSLAQAGNANDVMMRSPGVQVNYDGEISVSGKKATVFIDGVEVKNQTELNLLQSENINKITINRHPSSEYSASSGSIINIETKKSIDKFIGLTVFDNFTKSRKYSNLSGLELRNNNKYSTSFASYSFNDYNSQRFTEFNSFNQQANYSSSNHSNSDNLLSYLVNDVFVGTKLKLNAHNTLQVQYSYNNTQGNNISDGSLAITNSMASDINMRTKIDGTDNKQIHNINALYTLNMDSFGTLKLSVDYALVSSGTNNDIDEYHTDITSELKTKLSSQNNYEIYSAKADYAFTALHGVDFMLGSKISTILDNGNTNLFNVENNSLYSTSQNNLSDKIGAAYLKLSKEFESLSLEAGLRAEKSFTNVQMEQKLVLDTNYLEFFPSADFIYTISDDVEFDLSYSRNIYRPQFSLINPTVVYFDSLTYRQGNPALKPILLNDFTLSLTLFSQFSASIEYMAWRNYYSTTALSDTQNPDRIKFTPVNIPSSHDIFVFTSYNYAKEKLNLYAETGIGFPFINVPYLNENIKIRKASWYFTVNCDYSLMKKMSIYLNLDYGSAKYEVMTENSRNYSVAGGIQYSLLKDRLSVGLDVSDILNTGDFTTTNQYLNLKTTEFTDNDNTYVKLRLKLNLNKTKAKFDKQSTNESELNRAN